MASEVKANKLSPSSGTALQIGDASDTITIPTGATFTVTDGIGVAAGGTGLSSFTAGDVLYATGTTTLAKLAKGTAEQVLAMNSGATAPDWGSVDLTVLPTITVAKGGTNLSSFTAGDLLYATGSTTLAKLAKGSGSQTLKMNSGATAPEWATVAAASADVVKLHSATFADVATAGMDGYFTSDYNMYLVAVVGANGVDGTVDIEVTLNQGGSAITSASYNQQFGRVNGQSSISNSGQDGDPYRIIYLGSDADATQAKQSNNMKIWIYQPLDTTKFTSYDYTGFSSAGGSAPSYAWFGGAQMTNSTVACTGFTLQRNGSTNMNIDKVTLYGYKDV